MSKKILVKDAASGRNDLYSLESIIDGSLTELRVATGAEAITGTDAGALVSSKGLGTAYAAMPPVTFTRSTTVSNLRIGSFAGSGALGSASRFSAAMDLHTDGQLDIMAVFGESAADLTSAYSAKCGRFRHVMNGITASHETYGLIGQVVAKTVTFAHLHAGLMGTFEVQTAATVSAGDKLGCAGVAARVGGATITVGSTGFLAGFLSTQNATTVTITSGGVHAAFACRKVGSGVTWAEALHIEDALVAIRFKAADASYAHGVKESVNTPAGNTSHAIKVMIGTTAGYIPVYDAETF